MSCEIMNKLEEELVGKKKSEDRDVIYEYEIEKKNKNVRILEY